MLILTRKPEQSIIINGNIVITVLGVERDRVKLGIQAPTEVSVMREEVVRAVGGENRRAATVPQQQQTIELSLRALTEALRQDAPAVGERGAGSGERRAENP